MYNNDNEEYIIKTGDVENFFKDLCIKELNKINFNSADFDCDGVEMVQNNINLYLDVMNAIYQEKITGIINDDTLLRMYYNPMGAYSYNIIKEYHTRSGQNYERVLNYMQDNTEDFEIIYASQDDWKCNFVIKYISSKVVYINKYNERVVEDEK